MKLRILSLAFVLITTISFAQIGIGTTSPDASAVLDMTSTTQGVLIPRMTTVQRTAITSPAIGLQVYDTDTKAIWFYNGAAWMQGSGGTGKFIDGGASDIAYYDGRVGIGINTFSTVHKLFVQNKATTDSQNNVARFVAQYEGTGTSASTYGTISDAINASTGTVSFGFGAYNTVENQLAGSSISTGAATRSEVINKGNIIFGSANSSKITNDGTMNFAIGQYINYGGAGTTTNSYGIFINSTFNQGTDDNYAFYSLSNADSYFEGNVGIGIKEPAQKLHISGVMRLEPQATAPAGGLGDMYAGTDGKLYFHNGTEWKEVSLN